MPHVPLLLAACFLIASPARGDEAEELAKYDQLIKPSQRRHWAFQPVKAPAIPPVQNSAWVREPIDAFILARLEARGWKPAPAAEPGALLRRVYLDLTGLPPTLKEQVAFRHDPSPTAFNRVIEDLLARPAYGERWGRHWLDVARYAESNGYERDGLKPGVWRYRDYVVGAFNNDKPFDRFILEQLAGDELPDATEDTVIATGFLRLGPWDDEPADPAADRFDQLDDIASTTAQAFLGMTTGYGSCHDHKFEPLTLHDYYRLIAVFNLLHRTQQWADGTRLAGRVGGSTRIAAMVRAAIGKFAAGSVAIRPPDCSAARASMSRPERSPP